MSPTDPTDFLSTEPEREQTVRFCLPRDNDPPWRARVRKQLQQWDDSQRLYALNFSLAPCLVTVQKLDDCVRLTAMNQSYIAPLALLAQAVDFMATTVPGLRWSIYWQHTTLQAEKRVPVHTHRDVIDGWLNHLLNEVQRLPHQLSLSAASWSINCATQTRRRLAQYEVAITELTAVILSRPKQDVKHLKHQTKMWCLLSNGLAHSLTLSSIFKEELLMAYASDVMNAQECNRLANLLMLEFEAWNTIRWHATPETFMSYHVRLKKNERMAVAFLDKVEFSTTPSLERTLHMETVIEKHESKLTAHTAQPASLAAPITDTSDIPSFNENHLSLTQLVDGLRQHVIGQDDAARALALDVFLHLQNMDRRGSLLLIGPTGCGKTLLVKTAADLVKQPFVHVNAAALVPEGIVGQSLTDVCLAAIEQADGEIQAAEHAIILFDEIDKLSTSVGSGTNAQANTSVLHQLLRFIDGGDWPIDECRTRNRKSMPTKLATGRMLILFAGAWTEQRSQLQKKGIGFQESTAKPSASMTLDELGLPLELIGRISTVAQLQALTEEHLFHLLISGKTPPLRELNSYLRPLGSSVSVHPVVLRSIAQAALQQGTGARGLVPLIRALTDQIYWRDDVAQTRFIIDEQRQLLATPASATKPAMVTLQTAAPSVTEVRQHVEVTCSI